MSELLNAVPPGCNPAPAVTSFVPQSPPSFEPPTCAGPSNANTMDNQNVATAPRNPCSVEIEKGPSTVDAGLLPRDHYKNRLPRWRYELRQLLLPLVRWETPYLAWMQEHCRTPFLDSYFALTANLGTHTFFMIMLPLMFWFGYTSLGRGVVHVLASGVFFSGFLKDLLCLPRPLSPPLHRITMSGSAALEYGFPSTHSTNAVSVALYGLFYLYSTPNVPTNVIIGLHVLAAVYTFSIVFGRLYCGMHGFLDVVVGIILGAILAVAQWFLKDVIDGWVFGDSFIPILFIIVIILVLVRIHPEPADACPCFDDGVAFAAVIGGAEIGEWHYSKTQWSWNVPTAGTVPYSFEKLGLVKTVIRVVLGVMIIFLWRSVAKPTFHTILPPVYRFVERIGLLLPRRHFTPASEYTQVPNLPDDTLPSLSELPALMRSVRHPRSDSVGPQSAADAYETLAYRDQRRRQSLNQGTPPAPRNIDRYEEEMGTGYINMNVLSRGNQDVETGEQSEGEEEREVFKIIEPFKPRVRYDVEVVTKLVVYAGIAWWAVEGIPIIFELLGLGLGPQQVQSRF